MSKYKIFTAFLIRKAKECESETYLDILSLIWHLRYSIRKGKGIWNFKLTKFIMKIACPV